MDILQAIERVSKAVEVLFNEIKELKLLASQGPPPGSYSVQSGYAGPDDRLKIVVGYLALGPGLEQDELLNTLLSCAQQVVRAEGAGLTLYDDQKDVLVFRAATGVAADKVVGWEVPLTNSQHGIAFRMRQVIASTPMNRAIDQATGITYRNVLIAPLLVNDEAIGTVSAVNKIDEDNFTPQDIEDYTSFAELAAHIIRQRMREYNLKQIIEGDASRVPGELRGVKNLTGDADLLEIIKSVVVMERRSPEMLPLCRQLIGALANMG
ncbi:MAG: GAF domain-containing protein [Syntrophobacteraceae bacterium]|jgi:GAF domain-containing protein